MCLTEKKKKKSVSNLHEGEHCVQVCDLQVRLKNAQLLTAVEGYHSPAEISPSH